MDKEIYIYDLEVFENLFMAIFKRYGHEERRWFLLHESRDDRKQLTDFVKNKTLISFNGFHYDDILLNYLIDKEKLLDGLNIAGVNRALYVLSGYAINYDKQSDDVKKNVRRLKYMNHFQGIDVMRVANIHKSLKLTAANLKHNKIQDLILPYDEPVANEMIQPLWEYNDNDVIITEKIYDVLVDDRDNKIQLRYDISQEYGVNVINEPDAGIFNKLADKLYSDATGQPVESFSKLRTRRGIIKLSDALLDNVRFNTPQLVSFYNDIKELEVDCSADKLKLPIPELEFCGLVLQFGAGGIHSVDKGAVYRADDNTILRDADVGSMYPATKINYGIYPAHLGAEYIPIYRGIRDRRLEAKRAGRSAEEKGLKIVVNTAYGKMNSKYHWMYDPLAAMKVTINGQLFILMLIEDLICNGIEVISANTDGVTVKMNIDQVGTYEMVCNNWCEYTKYELEYVDYDVYVRRDVNNYLARTTSGKIKYKGKFAPELYKDLTKSFIMPIVPLAISNYYLSGTPIEETIRNHNDIYDFCVAVKAGRSFSRVEYHYGGYVQDIQKSIRYYASWKGGYLYKIKPPCDKEVWDYNENGDFILLPPNTEERTYAIAANVLVSIFNDYHERPYDINMDYYIEECKKIICAIENRKYYKPGEIANKINKATDNLYKNIIKVEAWEAKGKTTSKAYEICVARVNKLREELVELNNIR